MSTTTPDFRNIQTNKGSTAPVTGHTFQSWTLIILVFVAGAASLAIEMSASRLLAPYFGTSLFVWANLIGLVLLYLAIGYYAGGRMADRYPSPTAFYGLTTVAALLTSTIPVFSHPILTWSLTTFASYSPSDFYGSLVAVILLFALPMVLLGCISPFAIRLRIEQVGKSGRIAGILYAVSTAGSIAGTFLSVLALMPNIGVYHTFLVFAGALFVVSILGLMAIRIGTSRSS